LRGAKLQKKKGKPEEEEEECNLGVWKENAFVCFCP